MRKKTQKHKSKPTDTLLKTSRKKDIELTEKELDKVSGGQSCVAGKHLTEGQLFVRKGQ